MVASLYFLLLSILLLFASLGHFHPNFLILLMSNNVSFTEEQGLYRDVQFLDFYEPFLLWQVKIFQNELGSGMKPVIWC